jgi:hypothetical protein
MHWLLLVALTPALAGTPAAETVARIASDDSALAAMLTSPERRVRSTDARIVRLIADGARRSRTFASIVRALESTDVIVYIQPTRDLPSGLSGRLLMLPAVGQYRYLRVQIRAHLPARELIALIGHELQHALEVAAARNVRDTQALVTLYQRIGRALAGSHSYDTDDAVAAGRQVRIELVG